MNYISLWMAVARARLARKNDAATGSFCTHLFSPVSSCLYLPCFYISLVYIPLVYISLVYISPEPWASHSFILSVPIHAQQAMPPHQAAASANQGSRGISPSKWILVHLHSSQDVCGLYEEVRCKSYDLAAVPGAFGTAATPAPHSRAVIFCWSCCVGYGPDGRECCWGQLGGP